MELFKYGDCVADIIGTGERSCDLKSFGDPLGFMLHTKGDKFVAADPFGKDAWRAKIKALTVFPFLNRFAYTDNTPEDNIEESGTGIMGIVREGKPQYDFTFAKGSSFHKALYNKRGNNRWNVSIVFETGILLAHSQDEVNLLPFNSSMLSVSTYKLKGDSETEKAMAKIQLSNAVQYNARHIFYTWEQLGFDESDLNGVWEGQASYVAAPTTTANVSVKFVSAFNRDDLLLGFDDINEWKVLGTQATPKTISTLSYNSLTESYDFVLDSPLVSGDTIQISTGSGILAVAEDTLGNLAKGVTPLATIT